jgi:hypothetical protein
VYSLTHSRTRICMQIYSLPNSSKGSNSYTNVPVFVSSPLSGSLATTASAQIEALSVGHGICIDMASVSVSASAARSFASPGAPFSERPFSNPIPMQNGTASVNTQFYTSAVSSWCGLLCDLFFGRGNAGPTSAVPRKVDQDETVQALTNYRRQFFDFNPEDTALQAHLQWSEAQGDANSTILNGGGYRDNLAEVTHRQLIQKHIAAQ